MDWCISEFIGGGGGFRGLIKKNYYCHKNITIIKKKIKEF